MERFRTYIDRDIDATALADAGLLGSLGLEIRHAPAEFGPLEELEFGFAAPRVGQTVVFLAVLEHARLKRISLGFVPEGGDEDDFRAFSAVELAEVLRERGEALARFFDRLFPG
jgi:hypothetical protein